MSAAIELVQVSRTLAEIAHAACVLTEHLTELAGSVDAEHQTALEMAVIAAERIRAMANAAGR